MFQKFLLRWERSKWGESCIWKAEKINNIIISPIFYIPTSHHEVQQHSRKRSRVYFVAAIPNIARTTQWSLSPNHAVDRGPADVSGFSRITTRKCTSGRPRMQQSYIIQNHRTVQGSSIMGYVRQKQRGSVLAFMGGEQEIHQRTSQAWLRGYDGIDDFNFQRYKW
jgi:hypothetical protein